MLLLHLVVCARVGRRLSPVGSAVRVMMEELDVIRFEINRFVNCDILILVSSNQFIICNILDSNTKDHLRSKTKFDVC